MKMPRNISIIAIFLLASQLLMVAPTIDSESVSPQPDYDDDDMAPYSSEPYIEPVDPPESPEEAAERDYLLRKCADKLNHDCGEAIFTNIFQNASNVFTDDCCRNLVSIGKDCHIRMVRYIAGREEYKANASITVPKGQQVWNKCALVAPAPAPSSK